MRKLFKLAMDNTFRGYLLHLMLNPMLVKKELGRKNDRKEAQPPYLSHLLNKNQEVKNYFLNGKNGISDYLIKLQAEKANLDESESTCFELPLAGINVITGIDELDGLWNKQFTDGEDTESLHRFGWLLRLLVSQEIKKKQHLVIFGEKAIFSWIRSHQKADPKHGSWDSYTVSERIVNWLFWIFITDLDNGWDLNKKGIFFNSLASQGNFLLNHLEYYGPDRTGNHLFKNGEALYILGIALKLPAFQEAGKLIITNYCEQVFTKSGFFNEDSSHYHLLVTKWLIEIMLLATINEDDQMVNWLKPRILSALGGVRALLVVKDGRISIPLIGDISPDCPPEWLLRIQDVAAYCFQICAPLPISLENKKGWHSLFKIKKDLNENKTGPIAVPNLHNEEGWIRVDKGLFSFFGHINLAGSPKMPGHAHQDTGAFVLFCNGEPMFVDTGRKSYNNTTESSFGISTYAHNNLIVDRKEPYPIYRLFYPESYLKKIKKKLKTPYILKESEGDKLVVSIGHNGYRRLKGCKELTRKFVIEENCIAIEDKIEGKGMRSIQMLFNTPAEVKFATNTDNELLLCSPEEEEFYKLTINGNGFEKIKVIEGSPQRTFGWWHPQYGYSKKLNSIIASFRSYLPWEGKTHFQVIEK